MTQNNPTVSAIIFATQHDDWSETAVVMLSLNRDSRIIGETRVKNNVDHRKTALPLPRERKRGYHGPDSGFPKRTMLLLYIYFTFFFDVL